MASTADDTRRLQRLYPQIFLACHVDHVRARRSPSGISDHDASLLGHLDERLATSPSELARHMGVGLPALSATIARLAKRGLVERRAAAGDRRRVELRLTRAGAAAMQDASVIDGARGRALLACLSPPERVQALDGLALLARAARTLMSQTPPAWRRKSS